MNPAAIRRSEGKPASDGVKEAQPTPSKKPVTNKNIKCRQTAKLILNSDNMALDQLLSEAG
ncbi:MAG: hypothetical protein A2589_02850 [Candidatus Vogelbacteria bacterium RIFOXYD1_FULL_46_19]|uniref:Uncharacterized protein n=1 Tax=Candidatus Vogelbacteria bacterium RIFOXYD1_FULL_46_19 TaxID=1802439 RepID=A0A1G2QGP0_9BACT|nr:MAG: hypothetical protein A2589_02850 [Candidatus Vogelbacteria bacterium RIFOXYD1_FULL_46_19]